MVGIVAEGLEEFISTFACSSDFNPFSSLDFWSTLEISSCNLQNHFSKPRCILKSEESTMTQAKEATLEDLAAIKSKAELVNATIQHFPPNGFLPGYFAGEIFSSLREYARRTKTGYAIADNKGFVVNLPNRKSFSPDAAFYTGAHSGMKFLEGAPVFAVEVRSEGDYGPKAELEIAQKREDYFAAGSLVVWDVDILSADVVRVYRASEPSRALIFRRGDQADAEPAVPGWTMPVDDLFPYFTQTSGNQ
jgi:Uma2 family endonuclease